MRVDRIQIPQTPAAPLDQAAAMPNAFHALLESQLHGAGLEFSKHAVERLQQRGLEVNGSTLQRLTNSVQRAESKGAKNTLILVGDLAFVVSVENRKVVTVADSSSLQDRVFTNIDSVVIG